MVKYNSIKVKLVTRKFEHEIELKSNFFQPKKHQSIFTNSLIVSFYTQSKRTKETKRMKKLKLNKKTIIIQC